MLKQVTSLSRHLKNVNHHQHNTIDLLINNSRSFSSSTILRQKSEYNSSTENMMKRLAPNRQFKQFWDCVLSGKYDSVTSPAFEKLKLFGNNYNELILDNQMEMKYLPIIIHRKCEDKVIRQPGLLKSIFSIYPTYDCFGYGVKNELSKKLYCSSQQIVEEFHKRRMDHSKAIEFMEKSKEDFSNVLLPLQMMPIRETDVWTWFRGSHTNEYDVLIIRYMDKESLIETFVQLASYCSESSKQFGVSFEKFPIQIGYCSESQKSFIESSIQQALQRTEDDQFSKQDYDLMKQFLSKQDIVASEKIGTVYFPRMRNNFLPFAEFFMFFVI